jgi:hypothetical protein
MPFELSFTKHISVDDPDVYWNECCWGGDKVSDRLLPMIRKRYADIQHDQEDWGWFIWFEGGQSKLAVDIFCDDPETGKYRMFLTSQIKPSLFGYRVIDSDELLVLKDRVRQELTGWVESDIVEILLDKNHDPIDPAI